MCPDHPTYCYPNGCSKKGLEKKVDNRLFQLVPHIHSIKDKDQITFLVNPQKDFLENFLDTKSASETMEKVNAEQNKFCKCILLTELFISAILIVCYLYVTFIRLKELSLLQ